MSATRFRVQEESSARSSEVSDASRADEPFDSGVESALSPAEPTEEASLEAAVCRMAPLERGSWR